MLVAIFVMFILSAYTLLLSGVVVQANQVNREYNYRSFSLWISEAGLEKAAWCFNQTVGTSCGGTYGDTYTGESSVSFGGGVFTTTVVALGDERQVSSVGTFQNTSYVVTQIFSSPKSQPVNLSFGMHTGSGGGSAQRDQQCLLQIQFFQVEILQVLL